MRYLLILTLTLASVVASAANADADSGILECSLESEKPTFVTSVSSTRSGGEVVRLGTCDKGDPINIEYVDRTEPYEDFLRRKALEDAEKVKNNPIQGAGDDNYPAVLVIKKRKDIH